MVFHTMERDMNRLYSTSTYRYSDRSAVCNHNFQTQSLSGIPANKFLSCRYWSESDLIRERTGNHAVIPSCACQKKKGKIQQNDWFASISLEYSLHFSPTSSNYFISSKLSYFQITLSMMIDSDRRGTNGLLLHLWLALRRVIIQLFHFPRHPIWLHEVPDFVAVDCGSLSLEMKLHFWVFAFRMHNTR